VLIQELSHQASLDLLARTRLGRLACSQGGQPYVVPVYLAYADRSLYGFTTLGKKIESMRANPLVCIEVDEVVSPQQWASVIVFGRYEELPDTPQWQSERAFAHELLKQSGMWWEPAYVKTILGGTPRVFSARYSSIVRPHSHTTAAPMIAPRTKASLVRIAVLLGGDGRRSRATARSAIT
jgi:nitroimidazol reductase NimA-like FMN-containing flavoprotein (pyridoxamine 5'-phosphate oxidase superfamily)